MMTAHAKAMLRSVGVILLAVSLVVLICWLFIHVDIVQWELLAVAPAAVRQHAFVKLIPSTMTLAAEVLTVAIKDGVLQLMSAAHLSQGQWCQQKALINVVSMHV